jgi:hypothetical protein
MRAGDGDIPSVLCGRANSLRDCCANIRHSNYGPDGPRQLWLEVRFQLLPKERGWIKQCLHSNLRRQWETGYSRSLRQERKRKLQRRRNSAKDLRSSLLNKLDTRPASGSTGLGVRVLAGACVLLAGVIHERTPIGGFGHRSLNSRTRMLKSRDNFVANRQPSQPGL